MRTQVGIVGAGPAGLVLAHLLRREAIDCVLLEDRSREHVEQRVRAGVLDQGTVDPQRARIEFTHDGERHDLDCDVVAGCDGFHGVCRPTIPDGVLTVYERVYPFAWLGILAEVAPSSDELIYCHHERGFALHSMRSPQISRLYLQVAPDEDIERWPDERIWDELRTRFATHDGWTLSDGPAID